MALMPGAAWRPLGPDPQREGTLTPTIVCIHTMVGSLMGTDNYFKQNGYGGTESHFGTGPDGTIFQWQDTRYRADANLDGNDRVISIENADHGPGFPAWSGSNVPAFTAAQIEANAKILAWCHRIHGTRLVLIPNSAQSSKGVGYHRQGCDPWRCAICEQWGGRGKVCPGDRRVAQIPQIIARANAIVTGTQPEEDDVTPADIEAIATAVWFRLTGDKTPEGTPETFWTAIRNGPRESADAVWWRSSGLKDAEGNELPLWTVLVEIHKKVAAMSEDGDPAPPSP